MFLQCEIIKSVAESYDTSHLERITELQSQLQQCASADDIIRFEQNFRETLLQISSRPLRELLSRVAMQMYIAIDDPVQFALVWYGGMAAGTTAHPVSHHGPRCRTGFF